MIGSRFSVRRIRRICVGILLFLLPCGLYAQVTASAEVEANRAYIGRSFVLNVYVDGSDEVEEPDLTMVEGTKIESLGGRSRNMESVTSINGRVERVVRKGYVYSFSVTPTEAGLLVIPPLEIVTDAGTATTREIRIRVSGAERTDDFRLSIELSKNRLYVGEEVVMTVTWYFAKSVRGPSFRVPLFDSDNFAILGPAGERDPSLEQYSVPVNGETFEAYRGSEIVDRREFAFLRFALRLLTVNPGTFRPTDATCAFEGVSGYRQTTDFWGNRGSTEVYAPFVIPADADTVVCLPLPERGRPEEFSGLVGHIGVTAEVATDTAHVGDPIPLRITVTGASGESVTLPSLSPFFGDEFRIDDKAEQGPTAAIESPGEAVFQLTVRPAHESVSRIPAVEIPYFDPEEERYRFAVTDPLPFTVKPTTVVTADDLEGPAGSAVRSAIPGDRADTGGILYNYDPAYVLSGATTSRIGGVSGSVFLLLLAIPPFVWLLVQAAFAFPAVMERPGTRRLLAYRRLKRRLGRISAEYRGGFGTERRREYARRCLQAYRGYLQERYAIPISVSKTRAVENFTTSRNRQVGGEEDADSIRSLLGDLERAAFAPQTARDALPTDTPPSNRFDGDPAAMILARLKPGGIGRKFPVSRISSITLVLLLLTTVGCADESGRRALPDERQIPEEAHILLESADEVFHDANRLAAEGSDDAAKAYAKAAALYRRVSSEFGIENGPLLYNTGNAYYLAGEAGYAILYYLRARQYTPGDTNLEANLRAVREQRGIPLVESDVRRVLDVVLFWHYDIPLRVRTLTVAVLAACFWGGLILDRFLKIPSMRRIAVGVLVLCLVLGTSVTADLVSRGIPRGVVVVDETECRRGDSLSYEAAFEARLPAGTEFRIIEHRPGWLRVRIPAAGGECWLPTWTTEPVQAGE